MLGSKTNAAKGPATQRGHGLPVLNAIAPLTEKAIASISHSASWLYQRTVVELILRRRHIEASTDGRHIPLRADPQPLIDTRRGHHYISNNIRTSRYTVWDFIPKQLFFQLTRVANFYFLCVGIPQTIPGLSTTGNMTTILPLMFFVLLTIAKEGFDDYRRHRMDEIENAFFATVLGKEERYSAFSAKMSALNKFNPFRIKSSAKPWPRPNDEHDGVHWVSAKWSQIKVGDVVRLCRDEPVPADIILIHSEEENGVAYIDTMALDGETNLKSKQVMHAFAGCGTIEGITKCNAEFIVEDPNPELFKFDGRVVVNGKPMPLSLNEVVYRGSVLRNTPSAIGLVINTGEECKLRMNSNQHPKAKKPALEKVCNIIVITLAIYVVVLSVGVSMGYVKWQRDFESKTWYLDKARVPFYQIIIAFIIMFNNVVPLALYISLEIVKIGQLYMLNSDINMYDEETDTPAKCNTNTILENLGQVGYVFSDKTGTLTDNVMKFRKLSVAGTVWLHAMDLEEDESVGMSAVKEVDTDSSDDRALKPQPVTVVMPTDKRPAVEIPMTPMSPSRPSMGRRSSSHWRSTGRPDHVQPEVNTSDMVEFIKLRPHSAFAQKAKAYLLAMALCHTCLPETKDGEIDYQASSPDELALVRAAKELGFVVVQRNSQFVTLQLDQEDGQGERLTFEILDVIEFSSSRKRMSIIVKYPDGRVAVICKGADSVILPRLKMSSLAMEKVDEVRKSAELEHEMHRRSEQQELRNSFGGRPSLTLHREPRGLSRNSSTSRRPSAVRSKSFEASRMMRSSMDRPRISISNRGVSFEASKSPHLAAPIRHSVLPVPDRFGFLDEAIINDDAEIFSKCFRHLDEFATEGLRTLVYAQRFIPEAEYLTWKDAYDAATTSLTGRQERIEEAAESLEQSFDLVGATAIEDKLQKGVPETIEKLRRANIKVWMLTGDKRETAINIGHSARICRPGSDLYIIDSEKGPLGPQLTALQDDIQTGASHSVVVIDGHTLASVAQDEILSHQFYEVMILVDSVICCRASPAQKALLVQAVRTKLRKFRGSKRRGITLAIGDGANDLAMISASHVGVGISGKEGLQAARVADYSIAQFRFLQRLLLVHGRWGYVRTAKFILCTFWKEMFFYLPTAQYQRYNGYTGTSLYEATSLMVFNTLFTSLCTICMGVWEQDLMAETLLAVPELYVYGQRNMGLNVAKYTRWMLMAAIEGVVCWYGVWAGYGWISQTVLDNGLHAVGTLACTTGILYINYKLMIMETHFKSWIVIFSFCLTTWGWFAWTSFLDAVFAKRPSGTYSIRDSWTTLFGRDGAWWATLFIVLSLLGLIDISARLVKRQLIITGRYQWPPWRPRKFDSSPEQWPLELWQELEKDPIIWEQLCAMARNEDLEYVEADEPTEEELLVKEKGRFAQLRERVGLKKRDTI